MFTLSENEQSVSQIVAETGLSESVVRKTLAKMVENGLAVRHSKGNRVFFCTADSLRERVSRILGRKARSVGYIQRRVGVGASPREVREVLEGFVAAGTAIRPFKSERYRAV